MFESFYASRQFVSEFIFPEALERRAQLERALDVDSLTGVANVRALERALPSAEADESVAVIAFDCNNFGLLNKVRGHQIGDAMLQELASAMRTVALAYGASCRVFRRGGDEFVMLVPVELAEVVRGAVESLYGEYDFDGENNSQICVSVTGTIGSTFAEADALLQSRKRAHKQVH